MNNTTFSYQDIFLRFKTFFDDVLSTGSDKSFTPAKVDELIKVIFNQQLTKTAIAIDYQYHDGMLIANTIQDQIPHFLSKLSSHQKEAFDTMLVVHLETALKHYLEDIAGELSPEKKKALLQTLESKLS